MKAFRDITFNLNGEYFDQIKLGTKTEEYRLVNDYWSKRLIGRTFDRVIIARGYPKAGATDLRIIRPWGGFVRKTITHPHFGEHPVEVFAIDVTGGLLS